MLGRPWLADSANPHERDAAPAAIASITRAPARAGLRLIDTSFHRPVDGRSTVGDLLDTHRSVLVERLGGGLRDPEGLDAVVGGARARRLAPGDPEERDELGTVGGGEAIEEVGPRGTRLGRNAGLDGPDRRPWPEPDADRILRPQMGAARTRVV